MKNKLAAILVGTLGLIWAGSSFAAITFNTFVTSASIASAVGGNSTIGFAYAGNKFVGSVYFNTQLYQTDLTGGAATTFGTPVPAFSGGETYVSSSLGIGGFGPRDVFATNMLDANRLVIGPLLDRLKSDQGHIVVRVDPGGETFRVIILDDSAESYRVKAIHGPYHSR